MSRLLVTTALCLGCGGTPIGTGPTLGHVVQRADTLTITQEAGGPGTLLYAWSPAPIAGSDTAAVVGVLHGVERRDEQLQVAWLCPPGEQWAAPLAGAGLPTIPLDPTVDVDVGRCWTRFRPALESEWGQPGDRVLSLDLGASDGVRTGDRYALYGLPLSASEPLAAHAYQVLGTCTVLPEQVGRPEPVGDQASLCRVEPEAAPPAVDQTLADRTWAQGGFAHAVTTRE